jgi:hypothetical protein
MLMEEKHKQITQHGRDHASVAAGLERCGQYEAAFRRWMLAASLTEAPQRQWCEGRAALCLRYLSAPLSVPQEMGRGGAEGGVP